MKQNIKDGLGWVLFGILGLIAKGFFYVWGGACWVAGLGFYPERRLYKP